MNSDVSIWVLARRRMPYILAFIALFLFFAVTWSILDTDNSRITRGVTGTLGDPRRHWGLSATYLLMTLPLGDTDFHGRWKTIRRRFVRALPTGVSPGPVWHQQIRLQEIASVVDYADAVRRCWFDPVRHSFADLPEDWVYSSVHREDVGAEVLAA